MSGERGRVAGLTPGEWSEDVRAALLPTLAPVAAMEQGGPPGDEPEPEAKPLPVLTVLAHQPRLLGPFLGWATALALDGVLPRREHELLALRAAWNCRSPFEWGHHVAYARAAGLTDDEIDRVVQGPDAPEWEPVDAALVRAADELHRDATVADDTWAVLAARFEPGALVEMTLVVGQYTMLSMLTNACGVDLEPGYDQLPALGG